MSLCFDLDLEDSKKKFFTKQSSSLCCTIIPSLVTKCSAGQKISSGQTFIDILNLRCDLDSECSNPTFSQDTLADDAVLSNQVWLQMDQQFRRSSTNSCILNIQAVAVTLNLKTANHFFCKTLCFIIIHHHTKFG